MIRSSLSLWRSPALVGAVALLAGCARAGAPTIPSPAPQPVTREPISVTPPPPPPTTAPDTARSDWHRLSPESDGVLGIGSERAMRELLANRRPQREVIVAVIDGGVDTAHTALAPVMWRNARDVAGNGRDDDNNGYADDTYGWNFMVQPGGTAVHHDTFELTRMYAACRNQPAGQGIAKPSSVKCDSLSSAYASKSEEVNGTLRQILNLERTASQVNGVLQQAIGAGALTRGRVEGFAPTNPTQEQAKRMWLQLDASGLGPEALEDAKKAYESQAKYGLDTTYYPRATGNINGSRDVTGPDALHGTHVAGIIGAARTAGAAVQGVSPNVRIMALRAVPDGDERDADVARAIRYAADNGALVINMSFGKAYSPGKPVVDSAVRYAAGKGVLLVHAAGNDGENNDVVPSFPTSVLTDGSRVGMWLEVGASSWKGEDKLVTSFSNYGRTMVDLFAPGEDILSTAPGGGYKRESGTSMAAPVVSGVAAMLLSYFPKLTPSDVRDILVQSVRTFPTLKVMLPNGPSQSVPFSALSRTGGLVDAYAAVKLALEREQIRP
ncbi:MAG: S8 family serine peptidase [Gemmatimonadaceae bacterium]|nr:S8 family serine peptidase [Gemmatimonadaceae bacterium]